MYSHQYPKMACYLCADEGVWSPSDKVPKRVETVRKKPIRKFRPVKGKDLINRVKLIKESNAPPSSAGLPELSGRRVCPCVHTMQPGCRFLTYLHGIVVLPASRFHLS